MLRSIFLALPITFVHITMSNAEILTPPPGHVAYLCKDPQDFPILFEVIKQNKGVPGLRCHKVPEGTDLLKVEQIGEMVLVVPNPFGDFPEGKYWTYLQWTVPKAEKATQ